MVFALIVGLPFVCALLIAALGARLRPALQGGLLSLVLAILFGITLAQLPHVTDGTLSVTIPWIPQLGLEFSLYVDGLAWFFVLLVTGIGVAVMLYAGFYFDDAAETARFLALMMAFCGAMLTLVLAGNVLLLFIAWEMTSIISFLLIGFRADDAARAGASQALVITAGGGLALLVGLLLMSTAAGTSDFGTLLTSGDVLREHPFYNAITILIMLGCFSKSAQFPLHFWLPGAMSAPTPASSYLHSATMVKAGIYLLARFYPVLGDTQLWSTVLPIVGLATMLIGAVVALRQSDLKGALAYATISQLGALVALIGLPHAHGIEAALIGILAHALYKCALFLVAGAIDHATGTRLMERLGGLMKRLPGYAVVTAVACLSMAGVPPLLGFVAKEHLVEDFWDVSPIALVVIFISAVLTVAMALILFWDVFIEPPRKAHTEDDEHAHHHALPRPMVAGPGALATLSLLGGIGVSAFVPPLIQPAVGEGISLHLFPTDGINGVFLVSLAALASGVGVFATRNLWRPLPLDLNISAAGVYRWILGVVEGLGDLLLKTQNGKIRTYLLVILTTVAALLLAIAPSELAIIRRLDITIAGATDVLKGVLILLSLGATLASILFRRHLLAALALGLAGYSVGVIILLEPAPDVAMVQFLVETLGTVLIIVMLSRISEEEREKVMYKVWHQSRIGLIRDVIIAVVIGFGVTTFALAAVSNRPTPNPIASWHLANAFPLTETKDVVASIVTEFRGMDTLIEITVFGMAALGVLSVLTRQAPGRVMSVFNRRIGGGTDPEAHATGEPQYRSRFDQPVTRTVAGLVLPFALMIAAAHILFSGSAPGDGFTAGVIVGLSIALWYVVFGYEETKARLRWLHPAKLIGIGLALAFGNAALPLLFGEPFLTHTQFHLLDAVHIELSSTTFYELGICLTVLGGVTVIMESISHPEEAESL